MFITMKKLKRAISETLDDSVHNVIKKTRQAEHYGKLSVTEGPGKLIYEECFKKLRTAARFLDYESINKSSLNLTYDDVWKVVMDQGEKAVRRFVVKGATDPEEISINHVNIRISRELDKFYASIYVYVAFRED